MNKWIKVSERLPGGGTVLVAHAGKWGRNNRKYRIRCASRVSVFGVESAWSSESGAFIPDEDIHYWMPLPELPQEGETL